MSMEECMRENMRKLALWDTRTFKPIMSHEELDSIMATKGFISLPPTIPNPSTTATTSLAWKDYVYYASGTKSLALRPLPTPRLPHPRIDGLHIFTYRAFLDAVNFYLEMGDISDLFHIRGMPLHRTYDKNRKWVPMQEDESIFVYRDGTLDPTTENFYKSSKHNSSCNGHDHDSMLLRERGNNTNTNTPLSCIVSLKDVIL